MTYPLPETPQPENTVCVQLYIPDELTYITNFWGHLSKLANWFVHDHDEAHTAAIVSDVWKDVFWDARERFNARECGDDIPCLDIPATSRYGLSWGLQDPVADPDYIPPGWTKPPFTVVDTPVIPGAEQGDIITDYTRFPWDGSILDFVEFWLNITAQGLPRFRFDWDGPAEIELHLVSVPQGGLALVTKDGDISTANFVSLSTFSPLDFEQWLAIIEVILGSDFSGAGIVSEEIVEIIEEQDGHHWVDVTFLPVVDLDTLIGWGGGLRKVTVCGSSTTVSETPCPDCPEPDCEDGTGTLGDNQSFSLDTEECDDMACGKACIRWHNGVLQILDCNEWVDVPGASLSTVNTSPITDDEIDEVLDPASNPISVCGKASLIADNLRQIWEYAFAVEAVDLYSIAQSTDEQFPQWSLHRGSLLQMAHYHNLMGASYEDEMGSNFWDYLKYQLAGSLNSGSRGLGETQQDILKTTGENIIPSVEGRQAWRFLLNAVPLGVLSDWSTGGSTNQSATCLNPESEEFLISQETENGYFWVRYPVSLTWTYPGDNTIKTSDYVTVTAEHNCYGARANITATGDTALKLVGVPDTGISELWPGNPTDQRGNTAVVACADGNFDEVSKTGDFYFNIRPGLGTSSSEEWGTIPANPLPTDVIAGSVMSLAWNAGVSTSQATGTITSIDLLYNVNDLSS